jgi:anti-repressor protein
MSDLQIFDSSEFGAVRTIEENGKVLFCGKDVADALGYEQPHKAVERHCKYGMKCTVPHPQSKDKTIEMIFIPEGDLYRLMAHSKLPDAERFERWVFDEVIPSIRKHGAYMTPETIEKALLNPDVLIQLASKLKEEMQAKLEEKRLRLQAEATIEAQKPKVIFADAVSVSKTSILIGDLAKMIKQNGYDIGQKRLFDWMRGNGYLMKAGASRNMPTQKAMDMELFEVKESTVNNPDGSVRITKTTKVTGKGQVYFVNVFLNQSKKEEIEKILEREG